MSDSEEKTASFDVESVVSLPFESLYTEIESHMSCFRLSRPGKYLPFYGE
jgi:hypothetical protein